MTSEQPVSPGALVPKSVFWVLFFVVFIDLIGFGIVFPLLPLYALQLHISEIQIGLILGIYSLMQFIFAPILGRLSDRIGRRPVLLTSMLGTALSFFLLAISHSFWWFLIARALDGIAGSNIATAQACIADISPKAQRTRNLGMWIGAAFGMGFALGPFFGAAFYFIGKSLLPQAALSFPFLAAGLIALANVGFAYFKLPESLKVQESQHKLGRRTFAWADIQSRIFSTAGPLIVTYALVILAFSQMESTYTWISRDRYHLSDTMIYVMFGYLGLIMAFIQGGVVRRIAPKLGDKRLALMGCAMVTVSLIAIPLFHQLSWLFVFSGLLAVGESFSNPALISSISKSSSDAIQGETMGVTQSLASLSRFLGPLSAGYLYQHHGFAAPYVIGALGMGLAILGCFWGYQQIPDASEVLPESVGVM